MKMHNEIVTIKLLTNTCGDLDKSYYEKLMDQCRKVKYLH